MRIIFDLRVVQLLAKRGIGRYVEGLLKEIVNSNELEVSILISSNFDYPEFINEYANKINIYDLGHFDEYTINENFDFFFSGCFFLLEFMAKNEYDITEITFPKNVLKYCDQTVGILYDLIPLVYSGYFLKNYKTRIKYSIQLDGLNFVKHFFAISEYTKNSSMEFLKRDEKDFTNIYGGVNLDKLKSQNSDKEYNVNTRTNNIVDITGDAIGKNYINLAKSFSIAYNSGKIPLNSKLYLICACGNDFISNVEKAITPYGLKINQHVVITNYISDEKMVDIVSNARALVHTAYIEGLGLPVLESYATGTPSFASNTTAIKEFILPECSFDPNDNEQISNMIIRIYNDEEICKKSLKFGRELLKNITWKNASKLAIEKLKKLKEDYKKTDKIAIFIPGGAAIAEYTVRTHSTMPNDFDIFADINSLKDFDRLQSLKKEKISNIFPFSNYEDSKKSSNHVAKIFVLGNSPHHSNSLNEAIKTKGEKNRYLLLHEPLMFGTFWNKLNGENGVKDFTMKWYPHLSSKKEELEKIGLYDFSRKYDIYLLRPLLDLTGIKHIISLNEKCTKLILNELNEYERNNIKIDTVFLPFEKFNNIEKIDFKKSTSECIIGTFGYASPTKQTIEIVEAVNFLNKQNFKIKLLIAGPDIEDYLNFHKLDKNNLIIKNTPSSDEWLKLLNSVDLGIELRPNSHTNSSGCVSELTGLSKETLLTAGFVNKDIKKYFHFAPDRISSENLAYIIKDILTNKNKKMTNNNYIFEKYSFKALSEMIKKIVVSNQN